MEDFNLNSKEIKKVKVLGIIKLEDINMYSVFNTALYCLIVIFSDNSKEIVECSKEEFEKIYLNYIEI